MAESGNPTSQNAVSDATASSTDASGSVLVAALGSVGEGAAQLLKSALGSPRSAPGMSPRTKVNEQRESADASGSGGRSDGGADWEAKSKTGSEGAQDGHASAGSFAAPARSSSALSYVHSSTRSDSSKGRDGQKRHAMPCITLREDSRGYVTLFGMEPGGELERLGTVRSGDVIVEVDGKSALGLTEKQVRGLLVGDKDSLCTIHWIAPNKSGAMDVAERSSMRQHITVTELRRDIPVSRPASESGGGDPWHGSSRAWSAQDVAWRVSPTAARGGHGRYGAVAHGDAAAPAAAAPASWNPSTWFGWDKKEGKEGREEAGGARVIGVTARGERVSLYIPGQEGRAASGQYQQAYPYAPLASNPRSAVEIYEEDIAPQVVRRQWVAIGAISLLLFFVWMWALNGGPLAAYWAKK